MKMIHTREELLEMVIQLSKKLGRTPVSSEFPHIRAARVRFRTWSNFLKEAGLEMNPRGGRGQSINYTKEELITKVRSMAEELGRAPTKREFPHESIIRDRFKTWNNFLKEAGLPTRGTGESLPLGSRRKLHRPKKREEFIWKREEIIAIFHQWVKEHGYVPSSWKWSKSGIKPNVSTITRQFGSWSAFLKETGLPIRKSRFRKGMPKKASYRRMKPEQMIKALQKWVEEKGFVPTSSEWRKSQLPPSLTAIYHRFGSWKNFVEASGYERSKMKPNGTRESTS